jgi:hypothetical protein
MAPKIRSAAIAVTNAIWKALKSIVSPLDSYGSCAVLTPSYLVGLQRARDLKIPNRRIRLEPPFAERQEPVTNSKQTSDRTLTGQCLCGAVHYAVADEFVYAANCHCSNCRRATGSAFKPFAGIERDKLNITKGEDNLTFFGEKNGNDTRCKLCGSFLYSVVRDGTFVHVAMGTLLDDPTIRPTKHIFVGSKARWFTITDDLPQFEEHVVDAGPAGGQPPSS